MKSRSNVKSRCSTSMLAVFRNQPIVRYNYPTRVCYTAHVRSNSGIWGDLTALLRSNVPAGVYYAAGAVHLKLGGWRSVAGGENGGYTAVNHDISVSALSTRQSASIAEILLRILGLYGVLYGNFP